MNYQLPFTRVWSILSVTRITPETRGAINPDPALLHRRKIRRTHVRLVYFFPVLLACSALSTS